MRSNSPKCFFLKNSETGRVVQLPDDLTTIHSLSHYLLDTFLVDRGYSKEDEGKKKFISEVFGSVGNKQFTADEALERLSMAITSVYDIRKKEPEHPLNTRERVHVEYSIQKELESIATKFNLI